MKINREYKKQPYCCSECCCARFLKFPKPLCIITNKAFTHNTAKSKADWCPIIKEKKMAVVTLERADGRQIMMESIGAFPDMTPTPEPTEPEEVSEE